MTEKKEVTEEEEVIEEADVRRAASLKRTRGARDDTAGASVIQRSRPFSHPERRLPESKDLARSASS
ncbi:MAG TPA: hypothetical protein VNE82_20985 [Candidatus Binataceae bacterium]|nr:hypothetical protein [Candidatus Binataceae bacterium]